MNILELCLSYGHGGLELYALKTAKWFAQDSAHTLFSAIRPRTMLDEKFTENNLRHEYFKPWFRHFPLITAWKLARFIRKNNIQVIHIHWAYDFFLAVLAKVLSRRNVKLVYTRQMALTRKKFDPYHRFLYKNVDAYIVITRTLYDEALKYLPLNKQRLSLLYYGVPAARESSADCDKYLEQHKISKSAFKLAIFGRIEHGKGQHLVVDSVKRLRQCGKNIQAAMIGHIMDEKYYEQLSQTIKENTLDEYVHYTGFHGKPISIMPCFDVVVLASQCETFGLVLPEAMRAGVTVIGSNCGGVPEIITHEKTGLLFESQDSISLTEQIEKLIDNPEFKRKLASAGKKDADQRFSEENHFKSLSRILENAG